MWVAGVAVSAKSKGGMQDIQTGEAKWEVSLVMWVKQSKARKRGLACNCRRRQGRWPMGALLEVARILR